MLMEQNLQVILSGLSTVTAYTMVKFNNIM